MLINRWIMRCTALMVFLIVCAGHGRANEWLLVETRAVPQDCVTPVNCVDRARLISRDLMSLSTRNRRILLDFLGSAATVRNIPENAPQLPDPGLKVQTLQKLPIAPKLAPLRDHPGLFFDAQRLDRNPQTKGLSQFLRQKLSQAGVRFLSEEEWKKTPGRPTLSLSFVARNETAGCIVPFAFYMSIKEEVVLARAPDLKIEATVWSNSRRQNLASTRHEPRFALEELVQIFLQDWEEAHAGG